MSSASPALTVDDWNRLNRLLERGLALAVDERALWLQSLPPESAHLQELVAQSVVSSRCSMHFWRALHHRALSDGGPGSLED